MTGKRAIRPFDHNDCAPIVELWAIVFWSSFPQFIGQITQEHFARRFAYISRGAHRVWVAEEEGQLVGFTTLESSVIRNLFVHPSHQRRGIGRALVARIRSEVPTDLIVETIAGNRGARVFYERIGFRHMGERSGEFVGLTTVRYCLPAGVPMNPTHADAE